MSKDDTITIQEFREWLRKRLLKSFFEDDVTKEVFDAYKDIYYKSRKIRNS